MNFFRALLWEVAKVAIPTVIALLIAYSLLGQSNYCSEAIEISSLPFYDDWCVEDPLSAEDSVMYINYCGGDPTEAILDPYCGCWHFIGLGRWFSFTTGPADGPITMHFEFDLCSWLGNGNCGNIVGYYALFDDCPENGGTILSYPINGNNPAGNCWDDFSGNPDLIFESCFYGHPYSWEDDWYCSPSIMQDPVGDWGEGNPPWNFPTSQYWITFNLEANTSYYLVIFPPGSAGEPVSGIPGDDANFSTGCIDFWISGPVFLSLVDLMVERSLEGLPQFLITCEMECRVERSFDLSHWHPVSGSIDYELEGISQAMIQGDLMEPGEDLVVYYRATDGISHSDVIPFIYNSKRTKTDFLKSILAGHDLIGRRIKQ